MMCGDTALELYQWPFAGSYLSSKVAVSRSDTRLFQGK